MWNNRALRTQWIAATDLSLTPSGTMMFFLYTQQWALLWPCTVTCLFMWSRRMWITHCCSLKFNWSSMWEQDNLKLCLKLRLCVEYICALMHSVVFERKVGAMLKFWKSFPCQGLGSNYGIFFYIPDWWNYSYRISSHLCLYESCATYLFKQGVITVNFNNVQCWKLFFLMWV